jgi:hypothetical protein
MKLDKLNKRLSRGRKRARKLKSQKRLFKLTNYRLFQLNLRLQRENKK